MTVRFAAGLAGVAPSTVRYWRRESAVFREFEDKARHGASRQLLRELEGIAIASAFADLRGERR